MDEEVGMDGAREIDLSCCKATTLINLDSEEEGIFLTGCAGGARVNFLMDYEENRLTGIPCEVKVSGLQGGHSGAEIHKERGNALCCLLYTSPSPGSCSKACDYRLPSAGSDVQGG